jgi:GTP-binding protein
MKKLAIIGKPNVGKSSFFNRILKQRDAITSEQAGTTRDVKKRRAIIIDKEVELIDTGGLDEGCELYDKIKEKSLQAAHEADIVLYMVDGKSLPEEDDKKLFYELQNLGKDIALVVNKIDNDKMQEKLWEYYEFGTEDIFGISIAHNRQVTQLLNWIYTKIPDEYIVALEENMDLTEAEPIYYEEDIEEKEDYDESIFEENDKIKHYDDEVITSLNVAIIGRVNVGKSSLLNALVKSERSVVSDVAGTTIDPIDETYEHDGNKITFIDTAGIRKRGKILGIEKYALMRTEKMLQKADMALLVLDISEPLLELDEKIAGLIDQNRLSCMIVLNKWDKANQDEYEKSVKYVRDKFKFLAYAPIISVSALTHQRVHKIYDMILKINENFSKRITTSKINEVLEFAQRKHQLPSVSGQVIRIYYATQYDIRPPKIALIMNKPQGLHFTYRRYLINQFRKTFDFEGTPLLIKAKKRGSL